MSTNDYYESLGVDRTATADEIQRAYRKLARTWHPDVNTSPEAEERFKQISEAYDVLSKPEMRERYDAFGEDFRKVPDDVDPAEWARAQQGRGGPGGPGDPRAYGDPFGRGSPYGPGGGEVFVDFGDLGGQPGGPSIEDLLGGMFGQGGPQGGAQRGPDQNAEIDLNLDDAYRGGEHKITLTGATGPRNFTVKIPAGVIDGQRIRLAGQGAQGRSGGPAGDLFLTVGLLPHRRYRLDGRDISADLPVSPWEAALGATVVVERPDGTTKVKIPPGTSSGKKLRLRGKGMPNSSGPAGDFHAVVKIALPETLSDRERELFEELADESAFDPRSHQ